MKAFFVLSWACLLLAVSQLSGQVSTKYELGLEGSIKY